MKVLPNDNWKAVRSTFTAFKNLFKNAPGIVDMYLSRVVSDAAFWSESAVPGYSSHKQRIDVRVLVFREMFKVMQTYRRLKCLMYQCSLCQALLTHVSILGATKDNYPVESRIIDDW